MSSCVQYFFLLFLLLSSIPAVSQQPNIAFKNITINEGLSQNSVVDIAEDTSGFMWFATQDGLNRYDGQNFLKFPAAFDDITTPHGAELGKITANGHELWLVTKGGKLSVFDLYTLKFRPFIPPGKEEEPLPPVSDVLVDENRNVWIGTLNDGLYHLSYKENKLTKYKPEPEDLRGGLSNRIRSIFEDSEKNIWVLTDEGVTRISGGRTVTSLSSVNTNVLTEDSEGRLWLGTFGKGIFTKEPRSENFEPFRGFEGHPLPAGIVTESIHADSQNRIWAGTYGNGLYIINTADSTVRQLLPDRRNPFALGFQDVLSITEDRKGGIWIGTDGGGISYYSRQFNNFNRTGIQNVGSDISIEQIRAIVKDDEGVVWLGTSGHGLTSFNPSVGTFETRHLRAYKPGMKNYNRVVSLHAGEQGMLWVGTQGNGLLLMDIKSREVRKWFSAEALKEDEKIPDNTIWAMLSEEKGQVWAATRHEGLLLIDREKGVLERYALPSDPGKNEVNNNVQTVIRINKSTLALGFERNGIFLLNTKSGKFTAVTNDAINSVLKNETGIKSLYYDGKGWLWAGTGGKGIIIIHLESGKSQLLNENTGLPNNMIYGIIPEEEGVLWAGSNKGIFRISYKDSLHRIVLKQILPFTVADGLQSNEFNTGAYHKSKDGTIWFGGISGLNYFHPEEVVYPGGAYPVVLTGAMVGNRPLESDTLITYKKQLRLPHHQNSLSFNYTVLDFVSPQKQHYQYKLEGYDQKWIEAGSRNYTAYTNLPPGDYTFKVKLAGKTGVVAPLTSLAISIAAPFWLQWWFIILAVVVAGFILFGFYRYRIHQYLQVQQVKNTISADLHDDIGSRLTNIQFLSAISKNKIPEGGSAAAFLANIDEEVRASAEALDEIVWNIKITDESLEDIVARMRRYASEALENANICYTVDTDADFTRKKMSMHKRRELFLVFKELLNNIRKHARAKKVAIHISIKNNRFYLAVRDDGTGFDPLKVTDRNGIRNIRQRVDRWHGILHINSDRGEGTFVEIMVPFDRKTI